MIQGWDEWSALECCTQARRCVSLAGKGPVGVGIEGARQLVSIISSRFKFLGLVGSIFLIFFFWRNRSAARSTDVFFFFGVANAKRCLPIAGVT